MQAGPFRVVSLMSREAADDLELEVGTLAYASIKATDVVVQLEETRPPRRSAAPAPSQDPLSRPHPRSPA